MASKLEIWLLKAKALAYILYHALRGDIKRVRSGDVAPWSRLRYWLERLEGNGIRVYTCPLPVEVAGFSYPPLPLIIVSPDCITIPVVLHEYGHIRAGFMSGEDEAEFVKEKCLWRGDLV